jgi:cell division protease FtsH
MCLPAGRVIKGKPLPGGEVWNLIVGKTSHPFKPDVSTPHQGKKPVVREVIVKPFDGYVYDLCGCENEAFFGGEKPILLHNSRVRDLFEQGKSNAPCIIFIDELDAVGRHRGAGIGGGHDEREQTLNQLLVEMDGFESNEGVIMIAATNRPDVLDPALLRPGRFDRMVVVDRPDVKGREGILNVHVRLKNIPLSRDVNLGVLARGTPGLSGADLENLINEAALLASRHNRKFVTMEDFENAKDKVMMGTERRSLVISDQEKRLIAYHEIGHALVAKLTPGSDPVHKVMIIPRGRALGLTHLLPIDERRIYQKSYLVGMLSYILGGRCAEKLVFGEVANGAADDLERATALARNMICEWGMSERLGPLTYGKKEEEIFLGREIAQHRDYSERTAELIDEEVKVLIESAERRADQILRENVEKLHALAHVLLELEVLDGAQIDRILAGEKVGKAFTMVSSSEPRSRSIQSDGRSSKRSRRRRRPVKTQQEDTQAQAQNTPVSPVERKVTEPPSDTQRLNDEKKTPEEVVS